MHFLYTDNEIVNSISGWNYDKKLWQENYVFYLGLW